MVSLKLCFAFNFNLEEGHEGEEDVVEEDDLEYDQQGAEMLEMQQILPQEQGYSQLFLSGQTNNKINNNCPFYY